MAGRLSVRMVNAVRAAAFEFAREMSAGDRAGNLFADYMETHHHLALPEAWDLFWGRN